MKNNIGIISLLLLTLLSCEKEKGVLINVTNETGQILEDVTLSSVNFGDLDPNETSSFIQLEAVMMAGPTLQERIACNLKGEEKQSQLHWCHINNEKVEEGRYEFSICLSDDEEDLVLINKNANL